MKSRFRIAELRKKKGMSQAELAKKMGYRSPATVAMWETGDRKPPSDVLPKLSQELGCAIQDLYVGVETKNEAVTSISKICL